MTNLQPYGQFQYFPPRIPDQDADVFAESGAARLLNNAARPDVVTYNFQDQRFAVLDQYAGRLYRSTSNGALDTRASSGLAVQAINPLFRSSTPQPNAQARKALPVTITDEMRLQANEFNSILQTYNDSLDKGEAKLDFGKCKTIDDLNEQLEVMAARYKNADSTRNSVLRSLRQWIRKSGSAAAGVNSWLALLPGDSKELSVLVGGIKIVFGAAARLGEMREETYRVLEAIPEILSRANRYCQYYPEALKLQFFVSKLYVAMMSAIGEIMNWYGKSSARKAFSAILKGPGYGDAMDACRNKLIEGAEKVEKEADMELHGTINKMRDEFNANLARLELIATQGPLEIMREMERQRDAIQQEKRLNASQQQRREQMRQQRSWQRKQYLVDCVQYNPEMQLVDQEIVLGEGMSMNRRDQGYAGLILQTTEVRNWLKSPRSMALAINAGEVHLTAISSVSLASILLTRTLGAISNAVTLSWFCGLHNSDNDVHDMIASMIGQLCQSNACGIDFSTYWNEDLASLKMYSASTKTLLIILRSLLQEQLKHTSIHMVIDGISFYETFVLYEQTLDFLDSVRWLTQIESYDLNPFKFLITSPKSLEAQTMEVLGAEVLDLNPLHVRNTTSYISTLDSYGT